MPQVVRPSTTVVFPQTDKSPVEFKITLELNVNINSNGVQADVANVISSQAQATPVKKTEPKVESNDDDVAWMIPDFGTSETLNFGKDVQ